METLYDVIIIGSGPAGLAAAIYARRACLESLVLEKEYMSGGQVLNTYEVDNYPGLPGIGGFDLGMKMKEHADQLGAVFVTGAVKAVRRESSIIYNSRNGESDIPDEDDDHYSRRRTPEAGYSRGREICRAGRILLCHL